MADAKLGILDYGVIVVMLCVSSAIGVYFHFSGRKQKTKKEFLMAGRNMPIFPVAFSLMATYMSAISLMGVPSEVYMYGTQLATWSLGLPLGAVVAAIMFLPIFFDMQAFSAYEYLERRFGRLTRSIVSVIFIFQTVLYMAVVLYAPSLALNAVTGLSTWTSVISLAIVCIFYCSLGGLKAVLWTDVFQAFLMFVTLFAVIANGSSKMGGLGNVIAIAHKGGRIKFNEFSPDLVTRYTLWNCLSNGAFFAISTFGTNQAQIQRILSVKSLKKGCWSLFLGVPLIMVFFILCSLNGVVIYSLFHDCDPMLKRSNASLSSADQLLPYSIVTLFGGIPGLSGLCICGIFSASLSTVSSALNSLTTVTMEDFVGTRCFNKKLSEPFAAFTAKMIGIAYGGLCLILTVVIANFRGISEAAGVLFGTFGGPVLGVFSLGMFTTTANEQGTLLGLLAGFIVSAWIGFGSYAAKIKIPTLSRNTSGCLDNNSNLYSVRNNMTDYPDVIAQMNHTKTITHTGDVLFMYNISYMWLHIFGTITVLLVGYISSHFIGCKVKKKEVDINLISPCLRKWLFPTLDNDSHEQEPFELQH